MAATALGFADHEMRPVADAMRDATAAASRHAANMKRAVQRDTLLFLHRGERCRQLGAQAPAGAPGRLVESRSSHCRVTPPFCDGLHSFPRLEENGMGATAGAIANDEMQSVGEAFRDAASDAADQAAEHAATVRRTVAKGTSQVVRGASRVVYSSSYVVSYAIVYAAVFAAHSLPRENPVMHGLSDGGRAARRALKSKA